MVNMKIASSVVLLSTFASAVTIPLHMLRRDSDIPPTALPQSASDADLTFQPVLDYDTDSCYNVPAIDAQGNLDKGLDNTYTTNTGDGCRTASYLDNQNVYARTRCNNGWCAYMYEHYFQVSNRCSIIHYYHVLGAFKPYFCLPTPVTSHPPLD